MNKVDIIGEIERYREPVLRACAGAYLHNLGKVCREFNLEHQEMLEKDDRKQHYFYQHIVGLLKADAKKSGINLYKDFFLLDKSTRHFDSENDITEKVFAKIKNILAGKVFNRDDNLFYPFNDCEYRWGDFIEYLGQGEDDGRLYFNRDVKKDFHQHLGIIKRTGTGNPYNIELIRGSSSLLTHLLNLCHRGASGGEKDVFYCRGQSKNSPAYMATPFGYESKNAGVKYREYDAARENVERIIKEHLGVDSSSFSLGKFIADLKPAFHGVMADSRRPFNNISVYDIGHSGMALLKSALWTLKGKDFTHDRFWTDKAELLSWRLLRFSLDG
ncbi:MAG TPA: hypothetical protein GXZ24_05035, partial [Firmicutes bacterium]|nr:hypothetical protein [Bacillota bacterium]